MRPTRATAIAKVTLSTHSFVVEHASPASVQRPNENPSGRLRPSKIV
jgi:hypothetical protein